MFACAGNCIELAGEFQAVLDKCPTSMAKRWLVLRVCSSLSLWFVMQSLHLSFAPEFCVVSVLAINRLRNQILKPN